MCAPRGGKLCSGDSTVPHLLRLADIGRTLGSPRAAAGKVHGFRTAHLHPLNAVVKPGAIDCAECQIDLAWSALKPASLSRLQQDTCQALLQGYDHTE